MSDSLSRWYPPRLRPGRKHRPQKVPRKGRARRGHSAVGAHSGTHRAASAAHPPPPKPPGNTRSPTPVGGGRPQRPFISALIDSCGRCPPCGALGGLRVPPRAGFGEKKRGERLFWPRAAGDAGLTHEQPAGSHSSNRTTAAIPSEDHKRFGFATTARAVGRERPGVGWGWLGVPPSPQGDPGAPIAAHGELRARGLSGASVGHCERSDECGAGLRAGKRQ